MYRVSVIHGDGIGPEIVDCGVMVVGATGVKIQ